MHEEFNIVDHAIVLVLLQLIVLIVPPCTEEADDDEDAQRGDDCDVEILGFHGYSLIVEFVKHFQHVLVLFFKNRMINEEQIFLAFVTQECF